MTIAFVRTNMIMLFYKVKLLTSPSLTINCGSQYKDLVYQAHWASAWIRYNKGLAIDNAWNLANLLCSCLYKPQIIQEGNYWRMQIYEFLKCRPDFCCEQIPCHFFMHKSQQTKHKPVHWPYFPIGLRQECADCVKTYVFASRHAATNQ